MHENDCLECQRLWREYAQATTEHIRLDGKLKLAQLEHNRVMVDSLTVKVEHAGKRRRALRDEMREHEATAQGNVTASALPPIGNGICTRRQAKAESIQKMLASLDDIADEQTKLLEQVGPLADVLSVSEKVGAVATPLEALLHEYIKHVREHGC